MPIAAKKPGMTACCIPSDGAGVDVIRPPVALSDLRRRKRQRAADADRVDAWKLADACDRLAKERRPLFDLPKRREIE